MDKYLALCFKITIFSLTTAAAFPHKTPLRSKLNTFLLYKVWPVFFVMMWVLMVPMVLLKLMQYIDKRQWEELLEATHMFFVGVYAIFCIAVVQISAEFFKSTIDIIETKFTTVNRITIAEFFIVLAFWMGLCIAYILYVGSCIYYGENLVPLWVPFVDNEKEITIGVFYFVWVYQLGGAYYIFCTLGIWGPFIIVVTICIVKELDFLIQQFEERPYPPLKNENLNNESFICDEYETDEPAYNSQKFTRDFIINIVEHHTTVQR